MDLGLEGKVAMVAAASKGLGFGIARELAKNGAKVSMCSRTEMDIQLSAESIAKETGVDTLATACDVRNPDDIQAWVDKTVDAWGRVDALLVNAGGPPAGQFKDISDEQWQSAFELTLMSTIRMIRATIPNMTDGGAILTVTSSSIKEPIPNLALSTVMRSGVMGLVKTLADELAGDNIRVNNLIPGRIDTDRVASLDQKVAKRLNITPEEARRTEFEENPDESVGDD